MKLTLRRIERQRFDATRLRQCLHVGALALLLLPAQRAAGSETPAWQSNSDITAAAESHVRQLTGAAAKKTSVKASSLDPRHRLPLCDQALESFMRRGARIGARTIVGVRCSGSKPWKVYVPVDVIVTAKVFTARQTLPRNHLLTDADLAVDERDVSRLVSGYISSKDELIGQRLKQQLIAGRIITPAMLQADRIITRGQTVTLIATGGRINISMSGKALMDGALNQRIRVENINSGRIIEGIVRSREHVEVLLPGTDSFFNAKPKVSAKNADTTVSNNDR
jgi:flagella basal body P-ring formation protein FlgA